jgi:hypothetical protein
MINLRQSHIQRALQKASDDRYKNTQDFYQGNVSNSDHTKREKEINDAKAKKLARIDAATNRLYQYKLNKSKRQLAGQGSNGEEGKKPEEGKQPGLLDKAKGYGKQAVDYAKENPGKTAGLVAGGMAAAYGLNKLNQYRNKPKSFIGKKIAALRSIYSKFMQRAQASNDSGVAAKLKKVAAKILAAIDKLMAFLQNKAG